MPSVMARRETPVARATAETPPYPIASLSAAATKRRIRSSRKGDRERNRRWISLPGTSCSIKQIYPNLLYLFSDNPLGGEISKAISLTKWKQWSELLRPVGDFVVTALKGVLDYIKETDITFSFVEGKLELKPAGAEAARTN